MIVGFLGVPLLWMAGDSLVRVMQGQGALPAESFWSYEASGALVGAALGGNIGRIWEYWRANRVAEARATALFCGAGGTGFYLFNAALEAGTSPNFTHALFVQIAALIVSRHLPFLLCVLLFFAALLAPRQ